MGIKDICMRGSTVMTQQNTQEIGLLGRTLYSRTLFITNNIRIKPPKNQTLILGGFDFSIIY